MSDGDSAQDLGDASLRPLGCRPGLPEHHQKGAFLAAAQPRAAGTCRGRVSGGAGPPEPGGWLLYPKKQSL